MRDRISHMPTLRSPGVDSGKATRAALWCTAMFDVIILLLPPMRLCECVRLWDASQCVSYTHY